MRPRPRVDGMGLLHFVGWRIHLTYQVEQMKIMQRISADEMIETLGLDFEHSIILLLCISNSLYFDGLQSLEAKFRL